MVRMGFVGAGFMGQLAHIDNYANTEGCACVALAEGRPRLARKVAQRYGIAKTYRSHEELCADETIDAVAAILPYALNFGVVKDLLIAGKHVITEKPMAHWIEESEELLAIAAEKNLVYQVGYMKRHDPGMRLAREILDDLTQTGNRGPLQLVRVWCSGGDWLQGVRPPIQTDETPPEYGARRMAPPAWFDERYRSRYEFLLNISSHLTNLLRFLTRQDFRILSINDAPESQAFAFFVMLDTGVRGIFEHAPLQSCKWDEGISFSFPEARLTVESASPMNRQQVACVRLEERCDGRWRETVYRPEIRWAFAEQAKHFIAAVEGKEAPISPASEASKELALARDYIVRLHGQA